MLFDLITMPLGLIASRLLFKKFNEVATDYQSSRHYEVSIVIPVRNEAANIPLLLEDLKKQDYPIREIICVDDQSTDNTAEIVTSLGVKLVSVTKKPEHWIGKSWACQQGASNSQGELILFLDADVRMNPRAVANLVARYDQNNCVISAQPFHSMGEFYEQFSLFFNLVQIAANGTCLYKAGQHAGLYGPVILIDRKTYLAINGHEAAKSSIVDDVSLGQELAKKGYRYSLFIGESLISFRMYKSGHLSLIRGWTKNFSTGASKTPLLPLVLVLLWVTSVATAALKLVTSLGAGDLLSVYVYLGFYLLWVFELIRISRRIGNFKKTALILYPGYLAFFIAIFALSMFKKIFGMNVVWKDRKIKLEK